MKLGFVSAILPELTLQEVLTFAASEGYDCIEVMCWPHEKATRRYAGVTHLDVDQLSVKELNGVKELCTETGVSISGLGYYPNPLSPDLQESKSAQAHIRKVIKASALLGLNQINTFIGRDWTKSIDDNWTLFKKIWKPLIRYAEQQKVKVGIENCPMFFTDDEWPGGKNLAISPAVWKRMFKEIRSRYFGLNYDPSHMIWQQMDYLAPLRNFKSRISHVHAKDVRLDRDRLDEVGILATPNSYHTPKLPGLGDVDWGRFFSVLSDTGYKGAVCVEVEDRAYEGSIKDRKAALRQSAVYLRQFIPKR